MPDRLTARHAAAAALQQAAILGLSSANPVAVTGAANNGNGLVRLAVLSSANLGGKVVVAGVTGTVEANGAWDCNPVDATHIDLYDTAFVNAYVSGGTVAANFPVFQPLISATLSLSATWPSQMGKPSAAAPQLLLYAFSEKNKSLALAGTNPQFERTLTLVVEARIELAVNETNLALTADTAAADPLGDTLDRLCGAVKTALLTNAPFVSLFEHIGDCETALKPDGTGARQIENAYVAFDLVDTEEFEPVITTRLSGLNLWVDALNVFDPNGTYTPPFPYTPPAAPRTTGPDGRVEIGGEITIPTGNPP